MIWRAARRRARVDAAVAAYRQWHSECDAVRAAYRVWVAASAFAGLMRRVRHLTETGLAHQLALIQAPPRGVLER